MFKEYKSSEKGDKEAKMRTVPVKRLSLIELFVLIALILVFIALFIPCCRSLREKAQEYDSSAKVLKDTIIKGERGVYRYTKFNIEGHDYFLIGGTGAYRKGEPVHCPDCRKCKGELKK